MDFNCGALEPVFNCCEKVLSVWEPVCPVSWNKMSFCFFFISFRQEYSESSIIRIHDTDCVAFKNVIINIWWQKSVLFTWTKIKNPKRLHCLSRGNSSLAVTTPLLCCSASVAQTLTSQQRLVPLSWHVHHNKTALPVFGSAPESNLQNSAILQLSCSHLSRLTRTLRMLHVKSPRKRVFSVCPLRARVWLQRQYFCGRMMIYIYMHFFCSRTADPAGSGQKWKCCPV